MRTQRYQTLVPLQPCPPNLCWTPPADDSAPQRGRHLDWYVVIGLLIALGVPALFWWAFLKAVLA